MGIRFLCPKGHKLNVKAFLAGRRGICPFCGAKFQIPAESTLQPDQSPRTDESPGAVDSPTTPVDIGGTAFEQNLETHVQQAGQAASDATYDGTPAAWSAQPPTPIEDPGQPPANSEPAPTDTPQADPSPSAAAGDNSAPTEDQPATADPPQSPSQPDPLAEMPNAVWYVRPPSGGQFGPAQADMMRGWLNEGRVSPETLVWQEGWADWQEAGSVFPELQPASSTPEAPPVAMANGTDATPSYRTGPRRRKNGPSLGLIVVLVAAVLLLLLVLVLILTRGTETNSSEQGSSMATVVTASKTTRQP